MKRSIILLIAFFIIIVKAYSEPAFLPPTCESQSGWLTTTQPFEIGGCSYIVRICYYCNTNGDRIIKITGFFKATPDCYTSLTPSQVLDSIYVKLSTTLPRLEQRCGSLIPCSSGSINVTIQQPMCWYKHWDSIEVHLVYQQCTADTNSAICNIQLTVCWDPDPFPLGSVKILGSNTYTEGNFGCEGVDEPADPEKGGSPGGYNSTGCFHLHTRCCSGD